MTVTAEDDPIHIAATEWFVRLRDHALTLEDSVEWQQWIAADARHAAAFDRIEAVWSQPWEVLQASRRRRPRPALMLAAAAIALAAVVPWLLLRGGAPGAGTEEIIRTPIGENRTIMLEDGSQLSLGADTEIHVTMDALTRRLELLRGEAFFTVTKDPSRPFVVTAAQSTVTAVGTAFDVRRGSDRTVITVTDGSVLILHGDTTQPTRVQLTAGQEATFSGPRMLSMRRLINPSVAHAWREGQLAFREEALRYVLEDVNRYSRVPIVISEGANNASIGNIRVTGTVLGNSIEGWIASLESAFDLKAVREPQRIVLTRVHP